MTPLSNLPEPSATMWSVIRESDRPTQARRDAFEQLLNLARYGFSTDQIDWEGLGHEALWLLFVRAATITRHPRSWVIGVIITLVRKEVRVNWPQMAAQNVESISSLTRWRTEYPIERRETSPRDADIVTHDLLRFSVRLDPALRIVANMLLVDVKATAEADARERLQLSTSPAVESTAPSFRVEPRERRLKFVFLVAQPSGEHYRVVDVQCQPVAPELWTRETCSPFAEVLKHLGSPQVVCEDWAQKIILPVTIYSRDPLYL